MGNVFRKEFHPKWLRHGIRCVGHWEPLHFRRRTGRGLSAPEDECAYLEEHTEKTVRALKALGINMIITHFYKGMGFEFEKEEMAHAMKLARLCHKHGLRCGAYVQWATLGYETFFKEEPRARNWIQVNAKGEPITLTYGHQPFRYMPCFNNPEYRAYFRKVVEYAVREGKFDLIHFDNCNSVKAEPESCRCAHCLRGFSEFLAKRYDMSTPQGRELAKQRFGHTNVDMIRPPVYTTFIRPWELSKIHDPATQEWMLFWADAFDRHVAEFAELVRSINPECAVEINNGLAPGYNRAFTGGVDHNRVYRHVSVAWSEEAVNAAHLAEDGRLVSQIRSFKRARSLDMALFTYSGAHGETDPEARALRMAEVLAYNAPTLGCLGSIFIFKEPCEEIRRYIDFFLRHERYYLDPETVADVAVLTNYHSLAYDHPTTEQDEILIEQLLIQAHVPFDIIYDAQLQDLSKYKALILPNTSCLTDEYAAQIRRFVEEGGGLVATRATGQADGWARQRVRGALDDLLGLEKDRPCRGIVLGQVGRARAAWVASVEPVKKFEVVWGLGPDYRGMNNSYWFLPKNSEEIMGAIRWAVGGAFSIELTAPPTMTAEFIRQPSGRIMIHLVNFDLTHDVPSVGVRLKFGDMPKRIQAFSPDERQPQRIAPSREFIVQGIRRYKLVVIE